MNAPAFRFLIIILISAFAAGCANIVPPSGGEKDATPPKLVSVTPKDSGLNVHTAKIRFDFNEYITLNDVASQVIISPLLPIQPVVTSLNKHVTIQIPDSLLSENTTYRVTLGNAVRDLNENNIYKGQGYIFSTGAYFDSLSISGSVINSMTGTADTGATILLYNEGESDSAIVKKRPLYATHADAGGTYTFHGLPDRRFRIYALRDKNANLIFDDRTEWIAFSEASIHPGQDSNLKTPLRTFPLAGTDTLPQTTGAANAVAGSGKGGSRNPGTSIAYTVAVDTTDTKKRSQEINKPLIIAFEKKIGATDSSRFFLSYDSAGVTVEAPVKVSVDTAKSLIKLATPWAQNTLYTLRLQKGFAKDSAGNDFLPGRYPFRTKRDDDYAKLLIHLPAKYYGAGYVLQVTNETDTIYKRPVLDTNVALTRIPPGTYRLLIIEDNNRNGYWDTGDLFGKKQPERVIPFDRTIMLKPGWENQEDFESAAPAAKGKSPEKTTPGAFR